MPVAFGAPSATARDAFSPNACRTSCVRMRGAPPVPKRSCIRAQEVVRAVAFAVGGEAGARLIARLRLTVSAATLRRLIRRAEVPVVAAPRVSGLGDFALRRRHR